MKRAQQVKNDVLGRALFMDKPEVVEFAIVHGAEIASVRFLDVLLTGDRAIVAVLPRTGRRSHCRRSIRAGLSSAACQDNGYGSYLDCRPCRPEAC